MTKIEEYKAVVGGKADYERNELGWEMSLPSVARLDDSVARQRTGRSGKLAVIRARASKKEVCPRRVFGSALGRCWRRSLNTQLAEPWHSQSVWPSFCFFFAYRFALLAKEGDGLGMGASQHKKRMTQICAKPSWEANARGR